MGPICDGKGERGENDGREEKQTNSVGLDPHNVWDGSTPMFEMTGPDGSMGSWPSGLEAVVNVASTVPGIGHVAR